MRRKNLPYDNLTIEAHIPTLAEAQKRYKETGEFIITSNSPESTDYEGDTPNDAFEHTLNHEFDKVDFGMRESDARNVVQSTPAAASAAVPSAGGETSASE